MSIWIPLSGIETGSVSSSWFTHARQASNWNGSRRFSPGLTACSNRSLISSARRCAGALRVCATRLVGHELLQVIEAHGLPDPERPVLHLGEIFGVVDGGQGLVAVVAAHRHRVVVAKQCGQAAHPRHRVVADDVGGGEAAAGTQHPRDLGQGLAGVEKYKNEEKKTGCSTTRRLLHIA